MLIHLTQPDIDAASRSASPVSLAIARTLGVGSVIVYKADPPYDHAEDIRGYWLRWRGGEYYLPYRAQIICEIWEYNVPAIKVRLASGEKRMVPWGDIVRPCKFEIEGLEK